MRRTRIQRYWLVFVMGVVVGLAACTATSPTSPPEPLTSPSSSTTPLSATATPAFDEDAMAEKRLLMVERTIEDRGITDPDVLRAMRTVARHHFVPAEYVNQAYADHPLPIGYGQTISQPYIVAWMTELLALQPGEKVLEIGTGSGYQAAVLAELGEIDVYSIEIVPELAEQAATRLHDLGYTEVNVKQGDGYYGWEEHAPFDAIIVTAAPDHLPAPLAQQLKDGGRLVIPIGPPGGYQSLWQFVKDGEELSAYNAGGVRFVPFTGAGIGGDGSTPVIP
ncbi:MAG: protein-L-isoaspartate(D-aspartate) O-methyltransferase [Anaerolineae bacterium]